MQNRPRRLKDYGAYMTTCALTPHTKTRRLFSCLTIAAIALSACMFGLNPAHAQAGEGLVNNNPPPEIHIYKWDKVTGTWINCHITPNHSACNVGGVLPIPIGPVIIPLNVETGVGCGQNGFSLLGNASLPLSCSNVSPCLIQGVQVICSGGVGQVTCSFFTYQNGSWVPQGSATFNLNDAIDVVVDCFGRVTHTLRQFVRNHVTICPDGYAGLPSFPIGNPSDPQTTCIPFLDIKF